MSKPLVPEPIRALIARWIPRLAFVIFVFLTVSWLKSPSKSTGFDWVMYQDTARLLLSSRVDLIYPGITEGLPFFYPPYFIWPIAPLGLLTRTWGYVTCALAMVVALASALGLLSRTIPGSWKSFATVLVVVLSSASWTVMLQIGHISAWFLFVLAAGLFLWTRGKNALAGAVLSLMMFKPNLGCVFPALLLVRRQWTHLAGWICGFALLLLSTLPLGPEIWRDYFRTSRAVASIVTQEIPMWKQQTVYAFWCTVIDTRHSRLILMSWLVSIGPLLGLTILAWLKTNLDSAHLPRLFGLIVLMLVSSNVYLFLYDGLLLALPGVVWYLQKDSFRSALAHRVIGVAILFIYIWQHLSVWVIKGGISLVGPAVAVWLVADACDLLRGGDLRETATLRT